MILVVVQNTCNGQAGPYLPKTTLEIITYCINGRVTTANGITASDIQERLALKYLTLANSAVLYPCPKIACLKCIYMAHWHHINTASALPQSPSPHPTPPPPPQSLDHHQHGRFPRSRHRRSRFRCVHFLAKLWGLEIILNSSLAVAMGKLWHVVDGIFM